MFDPQLEQRIQNINGIWTVIGCLHQTESVRKAGRIDWDQDALTAIRPYIKKGDTVIDAGANIGTHTAAFLEWVGKTGEVLAFEPHPSCFECLSRNCREALLWGNALSDYRAYVGLVMLPESPALSYVISNATTLCVWATTIDFIMEGRSKLNFIKIDVEGSEAAVLRGARKTIAKYRPAMFIEINDEALARLDSSAEAVMTILREFGYNTKTVPEKVPQGCHRYDLLCTTKRH
jgi:FkbM family methyltransferase